MLVMRMLWLTPALFGPNSSDVTDTAAENTKPELSPTMAVQARSAASLPDATSKKKATGVGTRAMANHPVLAKYTLLHWKSGAAESKRPKNEHEEYRVMSELSSE